MTSEDRWQKEMSEIFGLAFLLERKLEYAFDKVLAPHNLTVKQWFVLAAIETLFETPPSIQEVARRLSTSHQNIKAIASNLERRGFVTLEGDPADKRITRLKTTAQSKSFWEQRESEDRALIARLFRYLTDDEIATMSDLMGRLLRGTNDLSDNMDNQTKEIPVEKHHINS